VLISGVSEVVLFIDSLMTLASLSEVANSDLNLIAFFASLLQPSAKSKEGQPPQISMVAVYHTDIPLSPSFNPAKSSYTPSPLSLLSYLATTIITVHSLAILLAEKAAQAKSLVAQSFGLSGEMEGVIVGLKPKSSTNLKPDERGLVVELEHRRKSGRGVREWFFLPSQAALTKTATNQYSQEIVILLDDHPLYRSSKKEQDGEQEISGMTFELALTDRQKLEREGVVLPYFDAQKAGGGGEGGRILYDMGVEDDFDEEEDEI